MKWKCGDLKCVQKPTRGRLSLTHLSLTHLWPLSVPEFTHESIVLCSTRRMSL